MAKTDRERFLRRLEEDPKKKDDSSLEEFLSQAGLSTSNIDSSSREALRELCSAAKRGASEQEENQEMKEEYKEELARRHRDNLRMCPPPEATCDAPPLRVVATNQRALLRHQPSDLTQSRHIRIDEEGEDAKTDATTAGSEYQSQAAANKMIMRQLEAQTSLLLDLQAQVEELKQTVAQYHQQPTVAPAAVPVNRGSAPAVAEPLRAAAEPEPVLPSPLTRFLSIIRVFWSMQNRQVQIDGAMLFKILFMFMVLSNGMSAQGGEVTIWSKYKSHVGGFIVVLGFLMHSGYMKFLHNFFIKNKIPTRIWNGEEINHDEEVPPAPRDAAEPQQREEPNNNNGGGGWRDTFFGGVIPDPQNNGNDEENRPNQRLSLRIIQDIVYLLGSFVLSVLPMWKPEGVQRNIVQPAPEEGGDGNDDAVPDQRDAMQALEESDDEDEDSIYGEE